MHSYTHGLFRISYVIWYPKINDTIVFHVNSNCVQCVCDLPLPFFVRQFYCSFFTGCVRSFVVVVVVSFVAYSFPPKSNEFINDIPRFTLTNRFHFHLCFRFSCTRNDYSKFFLLPFCSSFLVIFFSTSSKFEPTQPTNENKIKTNSQEQNITGTQENERMKHAYRETS